PCYNLKNFSHTKRIGNLNRQFYDNEREIDLAEQKSLRSRESKVVVARTVVFVAAAGSFAIGWDTHTHFCYIIAALLAMIFVRLVNYHDDIKRRKRFLKSRLTVLNSYIARARGTWRKRSNDGSIYLKNNRPQDVDLHIFGEGSIFQYICAARTKRGRDLLAAAFNPEPPDFNEVRNRQRGVAELLQRPRLSLDLEAYARLMPNNHDTSELIVSVEEELPPLGKIYRLRFVMPAIVLAACVAAFYGLVDVYLPLFVMLFNLVIAIVAIPAVNELLAPFNIISKELRLYRTIFERLESTNFSSKRLSAIRDILTDEMSAAQKLQTLSLLVDAANARHNPLFFIPGNALFLADFFIVTAFRRWRVDAAQHLRTWLDAFAEMEVLISLASIGQTRTTYCFPTFYEEAEPHLTVEGLTSLLVADAKGVPNDVELKAGTTIITGANMSGKTTWIRTLAAAVMVAYSGAPVCAKSFAVSRLAVMTSIRVNDDLSQGVSTFYAELLRIKSMIEYTERKLPMLACIDEIFKGTNVNDRVIGAKEAIRRLTNDRSITLVTTHDFQLCDMVDENEHISNAHFEEYYENDEIKFDFKLRNGRTHTTNAKYLLRMAGILPPEETKSLVPSP
ncbi:MAG: DNA mismatch repair protein MutS, partial [Selenomonadaceae bacterium]|nr:DNA mismatch repair protein MutS [Selenomonadaceae bacterium]